jgi:hypothetical protein
MPLSLIFVGIDWSEGHHDLCVEDESGKVLARRRIGNDPEGLTHLQATLAGRVGASPAVGIRGRRLFKRRGTIGQA